MEGRILCFPDPISTPTPHFSGLVRYAIKCHSISYSLKAPFELCSSQRQPSPSNTRERSGQPPRVCSPPARWGMGFLTAQLSSTAPRVRSSPKALPWPGLCRSSVSPSPPPPGYLASHFPIDWGHLGPSQMDGDSFTRVPSGPGGLSREEQTGLDES